MIRNRDKNLTNKEIYFLDHTIDKEKLKKIFFYNIFISKMLLHKTT